MGATINLCSCPNFEKTGDRRENNALGSQPTIKFERFAGFCYQSSIVCRYVCHSICLCIVCNDIFKSEFHSSAMNNMESGHLLSDGVRCK